MKKEERKIISRTNNGDALYFETEIHQFRKVPTAEAKRLMTVRMSAYNEPTTCLAC